MACAGFAVLLLVSVALGVRSLRGRPVEAARVARQDRLETIVGSGRVLARSKASLGSTVTERVESVLVEEGDRVRAGQILVRLDDREAAAARAEARAAARAFARDQPAGGGGGADAGDADARDRAPSSRATSCHPGGPS